MGFNIFLPLTLPLAADGNGQPAGRGRGRRRGNVGITAVQTLGPGVGHVQPTRVTRSGSKHGPSPNVDEEVLGVQAGLIPLLGD